MYRIPFQIGNDVRIGQKVDFIRARDDDGTSPNNEIRYSLSTEKSSQRATTYFGIDETTGDINVIDDLKRELFDNYRLNVVATDQGELPLNNSITVFVQVIFCTDTKQSHMPIRDGLFLSSSSLFAYFRYNKW